MKTSLHFVVPNINFNKNATKFHILLKQRLYEYTDWLVLYLVEPVLAADAILNSARKEKLCVAHVC